MKFTTENVNRLLCLADQFLENWAEDAVQSGSPDPDYEERQKEWEALRPFLEAAPAMVEELQKLAITYAHFRMEMEESFDPDINSRSLKRIKTLLSPFKEQLA